MSNSFHNTTGQDDDFVAMHNVKAQTQEEVITEIFGYANHLTASEVFTIYGDSSVPLTSIRRGMSNLKFKGLLTKSKLTRIGMYGKPECIYSLKS